MVIYMVPVVCRQGGAHSWSRFRFAGAPPLPPLSPFLPCPRRVVVSGVQILDGRLYRACDDIGFPFVSLTRARIMNEVDHFTADATEPPVLRLFRCSQ